jgi:putative flavoprotein involved in K+ transport
MPEVHFHVRWPGGEEEACYSPSTIILEYLQAGSDYSVPEFLSRTRSALEVASERVRARYGYACSSALDQLRSIQERIESMSPVERAQRVTVLALERQEARDARRSSEVRRLAPDPPSFPVIIIGGGHAGLSMSYCLKKAGVEHVVLEAERVAHSWRSKRWDTFCLVTPNWQCTLPGHPYDGPDSQGFMLKDDIVDYVERYARKYELPVREGVRVHSLSPVAPAGGAHGGFALETSMGALRAEQVVVATGAYHVPFIPPAAAGFPDGVLHLHSDSYKNPGALPEGAVLVVGSGQSGVQIAEDLKLEGRQVHLAVGSAPRCARRYRGRDVTEWLDLMGYYDIPYDAHPDRDQVRDKTNHYVTGRGGGHDIDLRAFALEGMKLYGTLLEAADGVVRFADDLEHNLNDADDVYQRINRGIDQFIEKQGIEAPSGEAYVAPWRPDPQTLELDVALAGITSVVWSIGFRSDFSWVKCGVLDERGQVQHERGVTGVQGLYFLGLPWLYSWGSGRFFGVGRDAEYLRSAIERGSIRSHAHALSPAAER